MLAVAAVTERGGNQFDGDRARAAKTRRDLQVDQSFDPIRPRGDVSAAHRCREGFREAADADHARQAVERGEPGRQVGLEIGEDVVLDDRHFVGGCRDEYLVGSLRRQGRPGRVMERGIGDVEARLVEGERLGKPRHVRSARRIGHADDLDPMGAQQRLEIEVAGIVHQHRVARLQQEAADQIDGLRAGRGQQDLVGAGIDALASPAGGQAAGAGRAIRGSCHSRSGGCRRSGRDCGWPGGSPRSASSRPAASRIPAAAFPGLHRGTAAIPRTGRSPGRGVVRPRPAPAGAWSRRHRTRSPAASGSGLRPPAGHRPRPPSMAIHASWRRSFGSTAASRRPSRPGWPCVGGSPPSPRRCGWPPASRARGRRQVCGPLHPYSSVKLYQTVAVAGSPDCAIRQTGHMETERCSGQRTDGAAACSASSSSAARCRRRGSRSAASRRCS